MSHTKIDAFQQFFDDEQAQYVFSYNHKQALQILAQMLIWKF